MLAGIVRALSLGEDRRETLRNITHSQWPAILRIADAARLTLPLALRCAAHLPGAVRRRVESDLANNALLHLRRMDAYAEVLHAFGSGGIDCIILKGLAQWPFYCDDLRRRPQYDIDLYCPPESIDAAYATALRLGYEPASESRHSKAGHHLPTMIRNRAWIWRGDYYDPDRPPMLELHTRIWSRTSEGFTTHGAEQFWQRRTFRFVEGLAIPALHACDNLSFNAWHIVRHLLHGNLCAYHVYELAHFLERTTDLDTFWLEWDARGDPAERIAEGIAFRLALDWFEGRANPVARRHAAVLPEPVRRWFDLFGFSPLKAVEAPNKDELFLHLALARTRRDRFRIACRRIFPARSQRQLSAATVAARSVHHLRALGPLVRNGMLWWA